MYIEFRLPQGAGGGSASYFSQLIHAELHAWQNKYGIKFRSKNVKYTIRVTFDQDSHYSFFASTWNPNKKQVKTFQDNLNFRIVSDLNNRQDKRYLV